MGGYLRQQGWRETGIALEWAKAFYRFKRWLTCRDAYIKVRILADGGLCGECRGRPGYIVHHRKPLTQETVGGSKMVSDSRVGV